LTVLSSSSLLLSPFQPPREMRATRPDSNNAEDGEHNQERNWHRWGCCLFFSPFLPSNLPVMADSGNRAEEEAEKAGMFLASRSGMMLLTTTTSDQAAWIGSISLFFCALCFPIQTCRSGPSPTNLIDNLPPVSCRSCCLGAFPSSSSSR